MEANQWIESVLADDKLWGAAFELLYDSNEGVQVGAASLLRQKIWADWEMTEEGLQRDVLEGMMMALKKRGLNRRAGELVGEAMGLAVFRSSDNFVMAALGPVLEATGEDFHWALWVLLGLATHGKDQKSWVRAMGAHMDGVMEQLECCMRYEAPRTLARMHEEARVLSLVAEENNFVSGPLAPDVLSCLLQLSSMVSLRTILSHRPALLDLVVGTLVSPQTCELGAAVLVELIHENREPLPQHELLHVGTGRKRKGGGFTTKLTEQLATSINKTDESVLRVLSTLAIFRPRFDRAVEMNERATIRAFGAVVCASVDVSLSAVVHNEHENALHVSEILLQCMHPEDGEVAIAVGALWPRIADLPDKVRAPDLKTHIFRRMLLELFPSMVLAEGEEESRREFRKNFHGAIAASVSQVHCIGLERVLSERWNYALEHHDERVAEAVLYIASAASKKAVQRYGVSKRSPKPRGSSYPSPQTEEVDALDRMVLSVMEECARSDGIISSSPIIATTALFFQSYARWFAHNLDAEVDYQSAALDFLFRACEAPDLAVAAAPAIGAIINRTASLAPHSPELFRNLIDCAEHIYASTSDHNEDSITAASNLAMAATQLITHSIDSHERRAALDALLGPCRSRLATHLDRPAHSIVWDLEFLRATVRTSSTISFSPSQEVHGSYVVLQSCWDELLHTLEACRHSAPVCRAGCDVIATAIQAAGTDVFGDTLGDILEPAVKILESTGHDTALEPLLAAIDGIGPIVEETPQLAVVKSLTHRALGAALTMIWSEEEGRSEREGKEEHSSQKDEESEHEEEEEEEEEEGDLLSGVLRFGGRVLGICPVILLEGDWPLNMVRLATLGISRRARTVGVLASNVLHLLSSLVPSEPVDSRQTSPIQLASRIRLSRLSRIWNEEHYEELTRAALVCFQAACDSATTTITQERPILAAAASLLSNLPTLRPFAEEILALDNSDIAAVPRTELEATFEHLCETPPLIRTPCPTLAILQALCGSIRRREPISAIHEARDLLQEYRKSLQ